MDIYSKIILGCVLIFAGFIGLAFLVSYLSDALPDYFSYLGELMKKGYVKSRVSLKCKNNEHKWNGCTCVYCGKVRNKNHKFSRQTSSSYYWTPGQPATCQICGKTCNHKDQNGVSLGNSNCRCRICGSEVHKFVTDDEWWDDTRNIYKMRCHCIRCGFKYYQ